MKYPDQKYDGTISRRIRLAEDINEMNGSGKCLIWILKVYVEPEKKPL